jgi:hypothetical protein
VLEPRLQRRYCRLVAEQLSPAQRLASGLKALPDGGSAFAAAQAAWRFYENPRVGLRALAAPLIAEGRRAVDQDCDEWVLVVHDWSSVTYPTHTSKKDRVPVGRSSDLGYGLQTTLLVSDRTGSPLSPICLGLRAAGGVHCSRSGYVRKPLSKLDELAPTMDFVEQQGLSKPAVHIIDAEADSVTHYREWSRRPHRYFLVRADAERVVTHEGEHRTLADVRELLRKRGAFRYQRQVRYHGKKADQWIVQTQVTLTLPGWRNRKGERSHRVPGPPLTLRLVISEIRDRTGEVRAVWFLLTNVPETVEAGQIALWYYWRWRIESYFKLMKSAGHQMEQWQQETAAAVAKRLMVASMACVVVWHVARSQAPEAAELRHLLVRLSGRQMKRTRPFTEPALLAGLWVLLAMLSVLEQYHPDDLRRLATLPFVRAGPEC